MWGWRRVLVGRWQWKKEHYKKEDECGRKIFCNINNIWNENILFKFNLFTLMNFIFQFFIFIFYLYTLVYRHSHTPPLSYRISNVTYIFLSYRIVSYPVLNNINRASMYVHVFLLHLSIDFSVFHIHFHFHHITITHMVLHDAASWCMHNIYRMAGIFTIIMFHVHLCLAYDFMFILRK